MNRRNPFQMLAAFAAALGGFSHHATGRRDHIATEPDRGRRKKGRRGTGAVGVSSFNAPGPALRGHLAYRRPVR